MKRSPRNDPRILLTFGEGGVRRRRWEGEKRGKSMKLKCIGREGGKEGERELETMGTV